jgi:hypothetical protein
MRAAAAALLLLAAGACKPSAPRAGKAAPSGPATEEQRLIAANAGKPADADLAALYSDLDARFFGGTLPEIPVRWEARLDALRAPGAPQLRFQGLWGEDGGRAVILLNAGLKGDDKALRRTLCHEMVHEAMAAAGKPEENHGPAFQAELKRLSDENAFDGVAPTDGERDGLKAWLDEQRGQLKAAWDDLQARRAALKGDAGHEQVREFNDLVRRQNLLAETYNREAMRYNEMLVYPDGLAGDRLPLQGSAGAMAERR